MFVLGLDIGYSNLKLAYGEKGEEPNVEVLPVGAGPAELMPQQLMGGASNYILVDIDGEKWVAGVEPDRLQGWESEMDPKNWTDTQGVPHVNSCRPLCF